MTNILEFLQARLDDDEQVARTAIGEQPAYAVWAYEGDEVFAADVDRAGDTWNVTCDSEGLLPAVEKKDGPHIARHDPARVLRDVAAKRAVIAALLEIPAEHGKDAGFRAIGKSIPAMAAVYSDHPDYQKEWTL